MANSRKKHGVFCLEGDWWSIRDSTTIEPALQLLKSYTGMPYIHRDVGTIEEFKYYLDKWKQRGLAGYPILYLAFHGEEATLLVGDNRKSGARISLQQLGHMLEGTCKGRIIHFGSCDTMSTHGKSLDTFMHRTQALAVLGYRAEIGWIESAAFEILLLDELVSCNFRRDSLRAAKTRIKKSAGALAKRLGFRMRISKGP